MAAAQPGLVTSYQHASLAISTSSTTLSGILRVPEHRAIGRLTALVGDVVARLDAPGNELAAVVAECNAALEVCLELQREVGDRDDLVETAADDLKRLARLLNQVDRADVPFVIRQIRRVLGRFDA